MDQDKIGKFIFKLRTEKGLSQYQLADMIPISRQAVSKWERGVSIPDSSTLIRLSDIFKVSINELLAGKKLKGNSIKQLESTTLSILDANNNKAKRLKRNFLVSATIITILLLSFLSYYFINSYNSTKVYTVSASDDTFRITDGIYMTTNGKSYMKLSPVVHNDDININVIKIYYIDNKRKITISERDEIDNYIIIDSDGYLKGITGSKLNKIINNSYIVINYNDNEEKTLKLKFKRDYTNSSLFFREKTKHNIKMKNKEKFKVSTSNEILGAAVKEEPTPKEEITIVEDVESIKEELSQKENASETLIHDSTLYNTNDEIIIVEKSPEEIEDVDKTKTTEEVVSEIEIIDLEKIKQTLKEVSYAFGNTYIYELEEEPIMFLYYEDMDYLSLYKNDSLLWDYYFTEDRYNCSLEYDYDCKKDILDTLKKYLVKGGNQ